MLERLNQAVRYIVRATGLLFVCGFCVVIGWISLFGAKPSAAMAAGCGWVLAAAVLSWPRLPDAWRTDPPTQRQLAHAAKLGIRLRRGMTKGQLSDLIAQATGQTPEF